jgi:two-component system nitrogen regulation response regulator GlnG
VILARYFMRRFADELQIPPRSLSPAAELALRKHPFPGNIRQLENLCHWLTVMAPGQTITLADLPGELRSESASASPTDWRLALAQEAERRLREAPGEAYPALLGEFERTLLARALAATGGRRAEAAQLLGIGRNTLTRKLQELGME